MRGVRYEGHGDVGGFVKATSWRVLVLWAVVGGVGSYLPLSSVGVGAATTFQVAGGPYDAQQDFSALRETRHRLVGLVGGGVGVVAGLLFAALRSRAAGAVVGGLAGAAIGFGPYWDIG